MTEPTIEQNVSEICDRSRPTFAYMKDRHLFDVHCQHHHAKWVQQKQGCLVPMLPLHPCLSHQVSRWDCNTQHTWHTNLKWCEEGEGPAYYHHTKAQDIFPVWASYSEDCVSVAGSVNRVCLAETINLLYLAGHSSRLHQGWQRDQRSWDTSTLNNNQTHLTQMQRTQNDWALVLQPVPSMAMMGRK